MKNLKLKKLKKILKNLQSTVVAYSGGLDSTFLLKVAIDTLGKDNVVAVTAISETYPASEYKEARLLAKKIGARLVTIHTDELEDEPFKSNPVNRCYYCKSELFRKLSSIAKQYKKTAVLDGTNHDDLKDVRHGRKAAAEYGVKSPLLEAGLTKNDIRRYSKALGLSTHDKPSFACLASRIPFGSAISAGDLTKVDAAEGFLKRLGFKQVRVRLHKDIARIEILGKDFIKAVRSSGRITAGMRRMGFVYVTLDLAGYRTGSMHEASIDKI
ncbi:MAG: ATP-dependent sacrificial sulfur transferase LarE [Candidatus Omnitrophica bacterium]|nr:ATP-dependent sacrificial sulfur transferase LarE [Candidatus Omnitrophota bacterium]